MGSSPTINIESLAVIMKQLESLPAKVARDVRDFHLDKAARLLKSELVAIAPVGNEEDRRKQSERHRQKWEGTKRAKDSVEYVIRKYRDLAFSAFIGPEYPHGQKWYFDYYGPERYRHMFFWRPGETSNRKRPDMPDRIRRKRDLIQEVKDKTKQRVIADLERGVAQAFTYHMEHQNG